MRTLIIALAAGLLSLPSLSSAQTVYDEAIDGDLSDDNLAPTALLFNVGQNDVIATSTNSPLDRDFWWFTVGAGQQLDSIELIDYQSTDTAGNQVSFMAVEAGTQVTSVNSAASLLGSALIGTDSADAGIGQDVLDDLGEAGFGGSGFTGPLGPGAYTFWHQETAGTTGTHFRFNISGVPEPGSAIILGSLGVVSLVRRRK